MRPSIITYQDEVPDGAPVGGKAGALARLTAAKFPIPEWFVVTPPASASDTPPALAPDLAVEIIATAKRIAPSAEYFAVRSSALDEDGAEHSFAGQLDTFLFVPVDSLPEKVAAVWCSGVGERVLAYRRERGLTSPPSPPAVLIQRMLNSDASGVAFSADPVSGRRTHAIVSAVYGLGTALVSGDVNADTFTVDRHRRIVSRNIAHKPIAHRPSPNDKEGITSSQVDEALANQPAITDDQAVAISNLARSAERHFGRPQDIEWAFETGKLWLLQSRPITSMSQLADPDGAPNLWDNANIAESYSGITTPLTFSFARSIYESVYRQFARLMGVTEAIIDDNRDLFPRMLGFIQGRIYYNLISWYRLLALLPGFSVNRGFMEQMMGVKEPIPEEYLAPFLARNQASPFQSRVALAKSIAGLIRNHFTLPSQIARFYQRLEHALRPCDPPLEEMRIDELAAHFRDLERQLLLRWDAPLVNDFFAMIFYGVARTLTAKWCNDLDGTLQNDLLCAEGGMISAEPARRVREMAGIAAKDSAAIDVLCNGSRSAVDRWLESAPEFRERFQAYIEKFGDRCLEELKLESVTLHEEPLTLLRSVGQFARRLGSSARGQNDRERELRQQAEQRAAESLAGHSLRRMVFQWVLRHARSRVRDRENLRFERTRLFGRVRRIFLEIGKRLHAVGKLDGPRDVFYLTVEEILGFVEGTAATVDLASLAALRQREFARYRASSAPADRFATTGAVHFGNSFQSARQSVPVTGESLKGLGCCPGIVRGMARVITDPRNAIIEAGEILVAPRTDPGWIMLFPSAAGLIVEHGSLLSHSAIVAREMGIPAIVSVSGAVASLKTGDLLEMDGSTGVVRKLPPASL